MNIRILILLLFLLSFGFICNSQSVSGVKIRFGDYVNWKPGIRQEGHGTNRAFTRGTLIGFGYIRRTAVEENVHFNYGLLAEYRQFISEFYMCEPEHGWCRETAWFDINAKSYSLTLPLYCSIGKNNFFFNVGSHLNFHELAYGERTGSHYSYSYGAPIEIAITPIADLDETYSAKLVKSLEASIFTGLGVKLLNQILLDANVGYKFISGPELHKVGPVGVYYDVELTFLLRTIE